MMKYGIVHSWMMTACWRELPSSRRLGPVRRAICDLCVCRACDNSRCDGRLTRRYRGGKERCRIKIWIVGDLPLVVSLYGRICVGVRMCVCVCPLAEELYQKRRLDKLPRLQHTKKTTERVPRPPPRADPDVADGGQRQVCWSPWATYTQVPGHHP